MSAFFIAFWKGEERKNKSRENDMKTRMDFCIVFCMCRKEYGSVKESDLQRASKILRTEFGSDWKQIVQTLGTRELTHCVGQDLTSFMAFPERAEGGNNQWRGNCSPQVVAKLIQFVKKCRQYEKKKDFLFLDPMSGSGTSQDVAEKLHISSVLYDLNPHPPKGIGNWNALKDEVMHSADLIFFHPPYHDIIRYSGNMWGRPHEDDLSRCENYEDYIEKLNYVIKKLYFSLRHNGYLAILVGDIRQKGIFHSIAADMLHYPQRRLSKIVQIEKGSPMGGFTVVRGKHPIGKGSDDTILLFIREDYTGNITDFSVIMIDGKEYIPNVYYDFDGRKVEG